MMCQSQPLGTCPTIKATARLRRSRQWKEQAENVDANAPRMIDMSPPKKNGRRRRRHTKKQKQPAEVDDCDASTSTAACSDGSDDTLSLSNDSFDACSSRQKQTTPATTRRKRTKKSRGKCPPVVSIAGELADEEKSRYVGLDCEMVGIGPGGYQSRLARVSLVNWDGEVIYDAHVKVVETLTDYRTFVSGITPEDLASDSAVTFDEAQSRVSELLEGKILVGHGLKSDFRALALVHPWHDVRDTAKYEPFMKIAGPEDYNPNYATHLPKKLKVLAKDKLGMLIQEDGKPHSPVEDAVAALELYKKHRVKWERVVVEWKVSKTKSMMEGSPQ
jgi:RNA exonuclease 4